MSIKIKTDFPVAIGSLDHISPLGAVNDNTKNLQFIQEIIDFVKPGGTFLDLGCAGGGLVSVLLERGHFAVGIDGTPSVLNGAGRSNWERYNNTNLFLVDLREEFDILDENGARLQFDVISSIEVPEHIPREHQVTFLTNVKNHLKPGGLAILQIGNDPNDFRHVCLLDEEEWRTIFKQVGFELYDASDDRFGYPLKITPRDASIWPLDTKDGIPGKLSSYVFGLRKVS